jgi:hypothetical protein
MDKYSKIFLVILLFSYCLLKIGKDYVVLPEFFRCYYSDLIFVPVQLGITLWIIEIIKKRSIEIPIRWIFIQVLLDSLLFEWYLPFYSSHFAEYTADCIDVAMYVAGGILFYCFNLRQSWKIKNSIQHKL